MKLSVIKPEGMRSLGRPRRRWENNIRMDFSKIECENSVPSSNYNFRYTDSAH
jgi:hypothetical protein